MSLIKYHNVWFFFRIGESDYHSNNQLFIKEYNNDQLITVDTKGHVVLWEVQNVQIQKSLSDWKTMLGTGSKFTFKKLFFSISPTEK